jgi:hypothetical protein
VHAEQTAVDEALIALFPNPGTGPFFLNLSKEKTEFRIEIYNSNGRLLKVQEGTDSIVFFELKAESGVYYIRIRLPDRQDHIVKLVLI